MIPEKKATLIKNGVGIIVAIVAGLIFAPFAFIAIKGLIGLGIAACIALIGIAGAPWLGEIVANATLKGKKAEWARNPVETQQRVWMEKKEQLKEKLTSVTQFSAHVKNYDSKLANFKAQWPHRAKEFEEVSEKYKKLLAFRQLKYREAKANLDEFYLKLQEAEAVWNMAKESMALHELANMDEDPEDLIRIKTSMDSIENAMNLSFAQLDAALLDEEPVIPTVVTSQLEVQHQAQLTSGVNQREISQR